MNVSRKEFICSRTEGKMGRTHYLGLNAADTAAYSNKVGRSPVDKMVPPQPKGSDMAPGESSH